MLTLVYGYHSFNFISMSSLMSKFYFCYPKSTPVSFHLHAHSRNCVYSGTVMGCSFAWQRAENRTFVLLSCFYQQCTNIVLVLVSTSHLICISALFFFWKRSKSFDLIWLRWHTVRFLGAKIVLFVCLFYWSLSYNHE